MAFTETLEALGSWDLELSEETPDEVIAQVGFYGHLVLVDGPADVAATGNGLLAGARYVGVCRAIGKPATYERSGSGLLYWLGDEDDKGHTLLSEVSLTNATLAQVVTALLPPTVTVGTVYAQANPATRYTGKHVFQSRRKALAIALAPFGAELRVNGNFTVDVGTPAQLYDTTLPLTSKPSPVIVRKATGSDVDLAAVGGEVETEGAVWDFSSGIRVMGQTIGAGDEPDSTFVIGAADAPSVQWKDPQGNPVKTVRLISASQETEASAPATAALNLNRFNRATSAVKVTADDYDVSGTFGVGDSTYVYDPDSGFVDPANQVMFQGQPIHPAVVRVSSLTSPIVKGMTVAWRTDTGVWLDLTPYVVWESAGSRDITIGDLPKTLSKPSDPIQDRVDAARGKPSTKKPKAPTGLVLSTSSTLNAKGSDSAIITADWTPVTQYEDSTTVALSHYEVQVRPVFRAPAWPAGMVTSDSEADLVVVAALGYDVRVRAISTGSVASDWSSTATIIAAADSTAPGTPSDPVVTPYLGLLRVYWNGLTSVGGPMPSDFNRVDVHVGTTSGFTAGPSTLLSSLSTAGYAHVVAPYGSARYVRFIAYDHNGNPSAASATVSATAVQAGDGDIAALSVGKLTAGVLSADVTIAGRFATALTGARREMNSVGFQAFDASNNLMINLDGVNNLLTGRFRSALSGRRVEMGVAGSTNIIQFIAPDSRVTFVGGYTGGGGTEVLRLGVENPTAMNVSQFWNKIQIQDTSDAIFAWSQFNGITVGGNGPAEYAKGFVVRYASDRGTNSNPTITETIRLGVDANSFYASDPSGVTRLSVSAGQVTALGSNGQSRLAVFDAYTGFYPNGSGTSGGQVQVKPGFASGTTYASAHLAFWTPGVGGGPTAYTGCIVYNINSDGTQFGLAAVNGDVSAYIPMKSSDFQTVSDGRTKSGIRNAGSVLEDVKATPVRLFHRDRKDGRRKFREERVPGPDGTEIIQKVDDGPDETWVPPESPLEIGLIAQEAPAQIVTRMGIGDDTDLIGISLPQYVAWLHKGFQELAEIVDSLKKGRAA